MTSRGNNYLIANLVFGVVVIIAGVAMPAQATISYETLNVRSETASASIDSAIYNDAVVGDFGIAGVGDFGGSGGYPSIFTDFLGSQYLQRTTVFYNQEAISNPVVNSNAPILGWINDQLKSNLGSIDANTSGVFVPNPTSTANVWRFDGSPSELSVSTPASQGLEPTPVPEASTVIAGMLLLLSFGVCSLKSFWKFRV
jgi:hypothetical protein